MLVVVGGLIATIIALNSWAGVTDVLGSVYCEHLLSDDFLMLLWSSGDAVKMTVGCHYWCSSLLMVSVRGTVYSVISLSVLYPYI